MAEALSLVSGRGVRAGSQVEYEELLQKINSADEEVARQARIARDDLNEQMENDIEAYARAVGIWNENTDKTLRERYGDRLASGGESVVYFDKKNNRVVKTQSTWTYGTLQEKLDAIALHNFLFPENAYTLEGFGLSKDGEFQVIVSQPYVVSNGTKLSQEELDAFAKSLGFEKDSDGSHNYTNGRIKLRDLHNENAIRTPDGNIRVIDCVLRFADNLSWDKPDSNTNDDIRFSIGGGESAAVERVAAAFGKVIEGKGKAANIQFGACHLSGLFGYNLFLFVVGDLK